VIILISLVIVRLLLLWWLCGRDAAIWLRLSVSFPYTGSWHQVLRWRTSSVIVLLRIRHSVRRCGTGVWTAVWCGAYEGFSLEALIVPVLVSHG
jgi:hypothetical protein